MNYLKFSFKNQTKQVDFECGTKKSSDPSVKRIDSKVERWIIKILAFGTLMNIIKFVIMSFLA